MPASRRGTAVAIGLGVLLPCVSLAPAALADQAGGAAAEARCSAGARTLGYRGDQLYPDTGNGGYRSLHTAVQLVYDAAANRFLPGNHVDLTNRATQCLSSFSLDFERRSANRADGPDMTVTSVTVNGRRAAFRFVQPTYPGDPPRAGGPRPAWLIRHLSRIRWAAPGIIRCRRACSPELMSPSPVRRDSLDGTPCPANKLVITPAAPVRNGTRFTVAVSYTGRPGVHNDGDGTTEGWFRSDQPPGDGGFVTTEPVGSEDWMPLNDYPSAKPTYDFYDTVGPAKTGAG